MTDGKETVAREPYNIVDTSVIDWEHLDLQLDELLEEEDWNGIAAYVSDNERLLFQKWIAGEREHLDRALRTGNFCMTIVADMLSIDARKNAVFSIGALCGMLQLLEKQVSYEKEELYSARIAEKALSSVKNLDEIVLLLEQNGTLTHSALAKKLGGMNLPTLTDNMRKVTDRGLVYSQMYGRYKQYYLTDTGRAYARNLRKRRNADVDLEKFHEDRQDDNTKAKPEQDNFEMLWPPKKDTKHDEFLRTVLQENEIIKQETSQLSAPNGMRNRNVIKWVQIRREGEQRFDDTVVSFKGAGGIVAGSEVLKNKELPNIYCRYSDHRKKPYEYICDSFLETGKSLKQDEIRAIATKGGRGWIFKEIYPCIYQ